MSVDLELEDLAAYSITTGDIFGPADATLVLTQDLRLAENPDDDHSYFCRIRGWKNLRVMESGWPVRTQARSSAEAGLVISMSARGRVRATRAVGGGADESTVYDSQPGLKKTRTMINDVFDVFGFFCAIGTRRAVYRRTAADVWECLDQGCYDPKDFDAEFTGLVGLERRALYAVGTGGEIWRFDGRWEREDSGTNQNLNAICLDAEGKIYAVGSNGTCLRGGNGSWVEFADAADGLEYWSIAEYHGEIFATANLSLVLRLDRKNGVFNPVDFGDCPIPTSAYQLKVRDGILYCFGPKHVRSFNGTEWQDLLSLE